MVFTRLLNIEFMQLETHAIGQMPPYVAISHVWSEGLFSPLHLNDFDSSPGLRLLLNAALRELRFINYLWIDTWGIQQDDLEDKYLQIPEMGRIYADAQAVVACVKHKFSMS